MFAKNTKLFIYLHKKMNACINSVHSYGFETRGQCVKFVLTAVWLLLVAPASGLLAQASSDSVAVKALNPEAGAASLYALNFTLADSLYPDAEFEVTFPAGFDVSKVTIAGSKAINGGFAVKVEGQKVRVTRKGEGAVKLPGEKVDVMFAVVTNPANPETSHKINVAIKKSQEAARVKELNGSILITSKKVQ
jgi:hypothetical protein